MSESVYVSGVCRHFAVCPRSFQLIAGIDRVQVRGGLGPSEFMFAKINPRVSLRCGRQRALVEVVAQIPSMPPPARRVSTRRRVQKGSSTGMCSSSRGVGLGLVTTVWRGVGRSVGLFRHRPEIVVRDCSMLLCVIV